MGRIVNRLRAAAFVLSGVSIGCWAAGAAVTAVWGPGWAGVPGMFGGELFGLPFLLVGLVITVRRPGHPIGWGFASAGMFFSLQLVADAYADAALLHHATLPAAAYVGNVTQWIFAPAVTLGYTLPFLWFPEGELLSPRWRWVARVGVLGTVVMVLLSLLSPGPLTNYPHVRNPLGVDLPGVNAVSVFGFFTYIGAMFASAVSVVVRYRRSAGFERVQMRWLMVGVAGAVVALAAEVAMTLFVGDVGPTVLLLGILPICAGIAIMRYRLFDIDRVVSRAVAYLLVTGLLVGIYVGCIALAEAVLPVGSSSLTVAASTLAVAALFQPVRRRVQAAVDRRFNRGRYDAARTIDAFAGRLRDEVDPDVVRNDLLDATVRAVQPVNISLWVAS